MNPFKNIMKWHAFRNLKKQTVLNIFQKEAFLNYMLYSYKFRVLNIL